MRYTRGDHLFARRYIVASNQPCRIPPLNTKYYRSVEVFLSSAQSEQTERYSHKEFPYRTGRCRGQQEPGVNEVNARCVARGKVRKWGQEAEVKPFNQAGPEDPARFEEESQKGRIQIVPFPLRELT
ncbi:hypothetical protein ARMSODRAFT_1004116 [Armillaria solidipes]|uniref:Uncharacterized protein n=1 Tax=Armillaria solidipes TaxID=1076256 RepID=A0A2H3BXL4_9AGAR|nr:hypothetical protein ARMSODRAFT_1004116 [Armillaria solidipes]